MLESRDSPVARLASQIAAPDRGLAARNVALPGHDEAIKPGDIMILLPRREPFGGEIIRKLKERGVPVAGADRITPHRTDRGDGPDRAGPLRAAAGRRPTTSPRCCARRCARVSEEELFSLCWQRKGALWPSCGNAAARRPH